MKKLLFYIASAAMIFAFAGCSDNTSEPDDGNNGGQGTQTFVLTSESLTFPQKGGSATISVEPSSADVIWTIENQEDYEWCYVSVNDNDVTFIAEENPETEDRTAEYTFSCTGFSATLTVTQLKTNVLDITEADFTIGAEGGELEIEVSTNIDYTVSIPEEAQSWITLAETRALRNETVVLQIAANESTEPRTAVVELTDESGESLRSITIAQEETKVLDVAETNFTIGAKGGNLEIKVNTNIDYTVSIPEAVQGWITHTETRSLRNETVVLQIAATDSTEPRTATVELTGENGTLHQSITITQEGGRFDFMELCTDAIFREYVLTNFDKDNDGDLSTAELEAVTEIDVYNMKITSLSGIQCFPNLTKLDCSNNNLTELDVSKNTKLTYLDCDSNNLTTLDVSKNTMLTNLECTYNRQLPSLDVSKNTELLELWCGYTKITSLDLSNNPKLIRLDCTYSEQLASLNLSGCTQLNRLYCRNCLLTTLDLSDCVELQYLWCFSNKLTSLIVSGCANMTDLQCYSNALTELDLSGCAKLDKLYCYDNKLTSLNVSDCADLSYLHCYKNSITTLDLSGCKNLTNLQCYSNKLTTLNISGCTKIKLLYCYTNSITELDLSGFNTLTDLYCYTNSLTTLDLRDCTNITDVRCQTNSLTELDLSNCAKLQKLLCYSNNIVDLDISKTDLGYSSTLNTLDCAPMTTLKTLTLKTGWSIKGINLSRSSSYIPTSTTIKYVD